MYGVAGQRSQGGGNRRFLTQDRRAKPLKKETKENVEGALKAVSDMLNVMERFYYKGVCSFEDTIGRNGAGTLLTVLGFGSMGRDKIMEKIGDGDYSGGDAPESI